jgi:hypothetical protein
MTMPIDKLDLAALRKADAICFDHYTRDGIDVRAIRAIKRNEPSERDPYAQDITHTVSVGSAVRAYESGGTSKTWTCFEMIHTPQYHDAWQTIVSLLRVGDELTLFWEADNNSGYVNEAGLHHDQLSLVVQRGSKRMTFKVRSSVCPDNTARMCRAATYSLA